MAERRKNEPQLDQNQDHLVRKIFSKFRRDRTALTPQSSQSPSQDLEKGEKSEGTTSPGGTKVLSVTEKEETAATATVTTSAASAPAPRPTTVRASKWGRLLGSSLESDGSAKSVRDSPGGSNGSGNKVFPKVQKAVSAPVARQDTIEEIVELDDRPARPTNLKKIESSDSAKSEAPLFRPATVQPPQEYKEIMTNLMDFKVDMRLEVQKLNQKVARMEELLVEVLSRLGTSSPTSASSAEVNGRNTGAGQEAVAAVRKRRSKSRTKGLPGTRSSPTEARSEPDQADQSSPSSSHTPTTSHSSSRVDDDSSKRPYPRRPREFL